MVRDKVVAVFTFILGVFVVISGIGLPRAELQRGPGPGDFPILLGVLLIFLATTLFFTTGRYKRTKQALGPITTGVNGEASSDNKFPQIKVKRVAGAIMLLVLYLVILPVLGFILASLLFGIMYLSLLYHKRIWESILPVCVITILGYLLFEVALKVPLPTFLNR